MYKDSSQMRLGDFVFPYGELDPENDWVKLAALVPWDTAEEGYAAQFVNNGAILLTQCKDSFDPPGRDPPGVFMTPCIIAHSGGADNSFFLLYRPVLGPGRGSHLSQR